MKSLTKLPWGLKMLAAGLVAIPLCLGVWCSPALAVQVSEDYYVGGYLRTWASFNLKNRDETTENDRYKPSMLRGSFLLDIEKKLGGLTLKVIARADGELDTNYMRDLEDEIEAGQAYLDALLPQIGGTPGKGGYKDYTESYNRVDLREYYVDLGLTERVALRLGRQQVVWGETDFFRAMDIIHGFDYSWRFFLEPENEELRKPLILANVQVQVPELNGSLQFIVRPGWDEDGKGSASMNGDIGNTYMVQGGRWMPQSIRGLDLYKALCDDYHHPDGDIDDPTWAVRWSGIAGPVEYTVAYLRWFSNDPVVNPAANPVGKTPSGFLGDAYFPELDMVGFTANTHVPAIDAVFSTEMVYTWDYPFQTGSKFSIPVDQLGMSEAYRQYEFLVVPGLGPVREEDMLQIMVRMDKTLRFTQWLLGTGKPAFFSVQVFDKWLQNYRDDHDIIDFITFGGKKREHNVITTAILQLNYRNDSINPMLAVGTDLTNGGGFVIPSLELVFGDHWRLRAEADLFWTAGAKDEPHIHTKVPFQDKILDVEKDTHLFGYLKDADQFLLRLTYQF